MTSAVERTLLVDFTFCLPSKVSPSLSSRKMVQTFSKTFSSGTFAERSRLPANLSTRECTIFTSSSNVAGLGNTTILNLLFSAALISLTPRSLVLAVAIIENPFFAATSSPSSGMESRFSERIEINASCTSEAQREISSTLAIFPSSIA